MDVTETQSWLCSSEKIRLIPWSSLRVWIPVYLCLGPASITDVWKIYQVLNNILQMYDSDPCSTPELNQSDSGTWYT